MLTNFNIEKIKRILGNISYKDEVEIIFNNYKLDNKLSIVNFINVLKYMRLRSNNENLKMSNETSLDIFFDDEMNNKYEVSISGIKNINNFVNQYCQDSNRIILYILLTLNFITNTPTV